MSFKTVLKYIILALFVLNLPPVGTNVVGAAVGSLLSFASMGLLIFYYLFFSRGKPNIGLLYCGVLYFVFSAFQIVGDERLFITNFIKFLIIVVFGSSFFKDVKKNELSIILALGALSIIVQALFLEAHRGRSGGFYFNPNSAGFVALFGFAFSYGIKNKKKKAFLQILCTIAGFLTFSRTFIIMWVLVNFLSLKISTKNFRLLAVGITVFVTLLLVGNALNIGGARFDKYKGVLTDETTSEDLGHDSRTETWALFYEEVMNNPFFGGGYGKFQGGGINGVGAHNTYLLVIGESGIIPFFCLLGYLFYMNKKSWSLFKWEPSLLLMCLTITMYLLTTHNFYDKQEKLALILYLISQIHYYDKLAKKSSFESSNEQEELTPV